MSKSPEIEKFLDQLSENLFGNPRDGSCCVTCGSDKVTWNDFRTDLCRKEFTISFMCQKCQDSVFGV